MFEIYKRLIIGDWFWTGFDTEAFRDAGRGWDQLKQIIVGTLRTCKMFSLPQYVHVQRDNTNRDTLFFPYQAMYIEMDIANSVDFPIKHKTQQKKAYHVISNSTEIKYSTGKVGETEYPTYDVAFFDDLDNDIVADIVNIYITKEGQYAGLLDINMRNNPESLYYEKNLQPLFSFLRLMNIANIHIQTFPLEKATQKHLIKNKSNQTHYRILTVQKPSWQKKSKQKNLSEYHNDLPLHQVRGHLADYRNGKGLFGKYSIRVWVPDHCRGNKEYGEIKKGYKVKLNK